MRLGGVVAIAGLLTAACAAGAPTPVPPPTPLPPQAGCRAEASPARLCVLVLGDSIAEGTPLTGDDRWWVRLESMLAARLPDREVVVDSWAVPGSRVDVLESAARDQRELESFDLAIVIEGVNDEAWTPMEVWRADYGAAISRLEDRGLRVILATPPPTMVDGAFTTRYDPTIQAIREIAGADRTVLDIAQRWRADGAAAAAGYYSDLIHQGPAGQRRMADLARDAVVAALTADEP
jgi:lysophospholipase L1-like esterase